MSRGLDSDPREDPGRGSRAGSSSSRPEHRELLPDDVRNTRSRSRGARAEPQRDRDTSGRTSGSARRIGSLLREREHAGARDFHTEEGRSGELRSERGGNNELNRERGDTLRDDTLHRDADDRGRKPPSGRAATLALSRTTTRTSPSTAARRSQTGARSFGSRGPSSKRSARSGVSEPSKSPT